MTELLETARALGQVLGPVATLLKLIHDIWQTVTHERMAASQGLDVCEKWHYRKHRKFARPPRPWKRGQPP
jgi:hypothetical protein